MTILGGLDLHRRQITFDYVDTASGGVSTGRVVPASREAFSGFLAGLGTRDCEFVVEGCTGWWFVADELSRAGMVAHVADPAEAAALRGSKKRAKTDRADARHLRRLLVDERVPESWIPPAHLVETRALGRLYLDLLQARNAWAQRIHATVFHHGAAPLGSDLATVSRQQEALAAAEQLPEANRHAVNVAVGLIGCFSDELEIVHRQLCWVGRHQPAANALQRLFGVGELTSAIIWAEVGDARRFSSSRQLIRYGGLDVTVHESDQHRTRGHLSHQGSGTLRWAVYECGQAGARRTSPDYRYYQQVKTRCGHIEASLSVARKILRRSHHILVACGDDVLTEPTSRLPRPAMTAAA